MEPTIKSDLPSPFFEKGAIRAGVIYPLDFNQELDELEDLARDYAAL